MLSVSHKTKQYLLAALKVFIIGSTFWYIYYKISNDVTENLNVFLKNVVSEAAQPVYFILLFLGFAMLNWLFESVKWKVMVSEVKNISVTEGIKQSLISLSVSLLTPNRIGEYGAKAYFFEPSLRKKILLLNFFHNSIQMAVTVLFGLIGLTVVIPKFDLDISFGNMILLGIVLIGFCVLGYLLKERQLILKGLTIKKVIQYFQNISSAVKIKVLLFSVVRYVLFSNLFFLVLNFFGSPLSYLETIPIIFSMYVLVSVLPSVFIFDVVVRGGVAVWLFSLAEVNELIILSTVLIMWILNFVIPATAGSILFLKHKPASL